MKNYTKLFLWVCADCDFENCTHTDFDFDTPDKKDWDFAFCSKCGSKNTKFCGVLEVKSNNRQALKSEKTKKNTNLKRIAKLKFFKDKEK